MANNNNNNNNKTGGSSNINNKIEEEKNLTTSSNMANNNNKKTLQEWQRVLNKHYNAMADANRKRKWARREKAYRQHNEAMLTAAKQHGAEAVAKLLGRGVTLNTITKEEYEEAQRKHNTTATTFEYWE